MDDSTCLRAECESPRAPKRNSGPQSPYCSVKCRNRADYLRNRDKRLKAQREATNAARVEKVCSRCSAEFIPEKSNKQVFCSPSCRSAAYRDSSTKLCTVDGCDRPLRARGLCSGHYKAQHPNRLVWKKNGNPEVRRANLRRKTQLRRARITDPDAEPIDRDAIGDRDAWRCGLCCKRVDPNLPYPHPKSASLDHIVPLSRAGRHVRENVQIAHLACNVAKGNRGGGEQLLLVG